MFFVVTGHHSFKSLLLSRFFSITTVLSRRVVETSPIVLLICVREFVHFAIHFFISFKICTLISIRVRYTALWLAIRYTGTLHYCRDYLCWALDYFFLSYPTVVASIKWMKNVITEFFWYILCQGNLLFYFTVSFVILSASTMYSRRLCVRNNKVHDH